VGTNVSPRSDKAGHKDYSGTPLYKKLGIKSGMRVAVVNEPKGFLDLLEPLPVDVKLVERAASKLDVIVYFSDEFANVARRVPTFANYLAPDGGLWVCYPKKSAKVPTDVTFDNVQEVGLDAGLVDNKSCAIDDTWTALRFVYRLKDRKKRP
jgi:hypothetical protein